MAENFNCNPCAFCLPHHVQAKYRCPRCAAEYCSSACYLSAVHKDCVARFNAGKSPTTLRYDPESPCVSHFIFSFLLTMAHISNLGNHYAHAVESRLRNVSLESATAEQIYSCLNRAERQTFNDMLTIGHIPRDLASIFPLYTPWWIQRAREIVVIDTDYTEFLPPLPKHVPALPANQPIHPNLVFNLLNILLAYSVCVRLMDGDVCHDPFDSAVVIWDISHVLNHQSSFTLSGVDDFVSHAVETCCKYPAYFMGVTRLPILLQDVFRLISTHTYPLRALEHLRALFETVAFSRAQLSYKLTNPSLAKRNTQCRRALFSEKKVTFYLMYASALLNQSQGQLLINTVQLALHVVINGRGADEVLLKDGPKEKIIVLN